MSLPKNWRGRWIIASEAAKGPMPLLRCGFVVNGQVKRAVAYVCGLGQFELRVNGAKVGEDSLEPGWTDYAKRCLVVSHDITLLLKANENVLGVMLGNGMYNVMGGRYTKFRRSYGPPTLNLQLEIEYTDGRTQVVTSDESWRCADGPITFSCVYGGEDYDATREIAGWDSTGFDDSKWLPARVWDGPGGTLHESLAPPVRVIETRPAVLLSKPADNIHVYDSRQNMSGWPGVVVRGQRGSGVTIKTGELLDAEGRVSQKNTGSPVLFAYTLRGDSPDEYWQPRFSLTGFRYMEVTLTPASGSTELPEIREISGCWVHSAAPVAGTFECSNDLLNRIHRLILSAIRSNLQGVLTDCPHREKLGWLEQVNLMGPALVANYDLSKYLDKILADMRDAQHENGFVPTIAPQYTSFKAPWDVFNDSPEWGSSIVIVPWLAYRTYGDVQMLRDNYDAMKRYVGYLTSKAVDHVVDFGLADWYDIGAERPGFCQLTSRPVTATATYYADVCILRDVAKLLGEGEESLRCAKLADDVRDAFNAKIFAAATGFYDRGSQTAQAMPLALGMVPEQHRSGVLKKLVDDIRSRNDHVTAGDVGFAYLIKALSDAGRSDVILDVLLRTDPPSYGAQLASGATTLTEAWDANVHASHNHLMLGHAETWLAESLGGIRVDFSKPDQSPITVCPTIVDGVDWVCATRETRFGQIVCRWEKRRDNVMLDVTIPMGATGVVACELPAGKDVKRQIVQISQQIVAGTHRFEVLFSANTYKQ